MKYLIKFHASRFTMLYIILIAFTTIFFSCKKTDSKATDSPIEAFAANDNAAIVVPALRGMEIGRAKPEEKYNTFYGPQVKMGNGHIRTWVNITHNGKALAIGVEMTDGALTNLPQDPTDFAAATFILSLHQKAKAVTPFDHVLIDWNVNGHEPPGIYSIPHFDFHFYKISKAEMLAIPPYEVDPSGFDVPVPDGYMPPIYVRIPGGVPQMGAHWFDPTSPEWNGQMFTNTFIYGSYNGKVTFEEPMITLRTLQSGNTIQNPIPQPLHYDPSNTYYPTNYSIWKNAANGRHYVSLDHMMWR
ncbi:MAG: hypothetical protein ABIN48_15200 [Ginsengibacter sp.]